MFRVYRWERQLKIVSITYFQTLVPPIRYPPPPPRRSRLCPWLNPCRYCITETFYTRVIPYVFICFIFPQIFVNSCVHSRCRPEVQWNKNSDGRSASTTWMAMGLLQSKKCSVSSTRCTKQWEIIREKPKASRTGTNLHPRNVLLKYFNVSTETETAFCRCRNLSRELWKTKHWLSFLSKGQTRHEAYCWINWPITRVYTLSQEELVSFFLLEIKFHCIFWIPENLRQINVYFMKHRFISSTEHCTPRDLISDRDRSLYLILLVILKNEACCISSKHSILRRTDSLGPSIGFEVSLALDQFWSTLYIKNASLRRLSPFYMWSNY